MRLSYQIDRGRIPHPYMRSTLYNIRWPIGRILAQERLSVSFPECGCLSHSPNAACSRLYMQPTSGPSVVRLGLGALPLDFSLAFQGRLRSLERAENAARWSVPLLWQLRRAPGWGSHP